MVQSQRPQSGRCISRVPSDVEVVRSSLTACILVLVGAFSCVKIDERKVRERELTKFDENRRASIAEKR